MNQTQDQILAELDRTFVDAQVLLKLVCGNLPVIVWVLDANGTFTHVEGQGLESLSFKPAQLIGQSVFDVAKDYPDIIDTSELALSGETITRKHTWENRAYQATLQPVLNNEQAVIGVIGVALDITVHEQTLHQSIIFASVLDQTSDLVMITDADGIIEYVNPSFEASTGFAREEAVGKKPSILYSSKMNDDFFQDLWQTLQRGEIITDVFINKRKDGSIFYEEKTITPVFGKDKTISHYVSTGRDISERMRTQERLHYMSQHDALTKLPNRTLFVDRLRQSMSRARWHNRLVAVAYLDIDHFKTVNDKHGSEIGDQLLIQLTQRLSGSIRAGDTVARFGGDEFAVLLDDIASEKDISQLAKKLLDTLATPFEITEHRILITASFGISIFPNDADDTESLLRNADVAMYRAKDMGKNNYQFFSNEMSARAFERLTLENSLRHALQRREFFLLYQPQVDTRTGSIVCVEALLRWQHPDLGVILPAKFITLLEETGLIIQVSDWVLKQACQQLSEWHAAGYKNLVMSVNLSGRHFNSPEAINSLKHIIIESGIKPRLIELELTESMLMRTASKTVSALNTMQHLGVQIAVDDFGTGYSSLNYLRRFPISTLKIDRSFIRDVVEDADDAAITSAIIVMAQNLGLKVVAEGVETRAQKHFLQARHCHYIQGNVFSEPVDVAGMDKLLAQGKFK